MLSARVELPLLVLTSPTFSTCRNGTIFIFSEKDCCDARGGRDFCVC